jgi:hypothetical protein
MPLNEVYLPNPVDPELEGRPVSFTESLQDVTDYLGLQAYNDKYIFAGFVTHANGEQTSTGWYFGDAVRHEDFFNAVDQIIGGENAWIKTQLRLAQRRDANLPVIREVILSKAPGETKKDINGNLRALFEKINPDFLDDFVSIGFGTQLGQWDMEYIKVIKRLSKRDY